MEGLEDRIRGYWDADAAFYDRSGSHSGAEPVEAAAWRAALLRHLPPPPATVLDVGAGTGTMSLFAAELGYQVTALDLSPRMLERAQAKARVRGLDLAAVVGEASNPPPGPFDAVMERHVLWTTPDPVRALSAWREAAPVGRLVSFEGIWAMDGTVGHVRRVAARALQALLRIPDHHHREYEPHVLASLPLAGIQTPEPMVAAAAQAGWRQIRVERLRDVEWARRMGAESRLLGWLRTAPQFALVAQA
jgi:SAM-dependent methyltransferase